MRDLTIAPMAAGATVFSNRRAVTIWGCIVAISLTLCISNEEGALGITSSLLFLFALQATISFAFGVRLVKGKIALPRTLWSRAPLLIVEIQRMVPMVKIYRSDHISPSMRGYGR